MQTTIYIRKENETRWNAINDKSAWVNRQIENNLALRLGPELKEREAMFVKENTVINPIKTAKDARKAVEPILPHQTFFKKGKK